MDSKPTGEIIPGRDMVDWTNVDPRLGFAWQPTDSGKTVLRGSIGQFHAGRDLGRLVLAATGGAAWATYWLNWDGEWEMLSEWAPYPDTFLVAAPRTPRPGSTPSGSSIRWGRQAPSALQAVYKKTKDLIGWHILDDAAYEVFG